MTMGYHFFSQSHVEFRTLIDVLRRRALVEPDRRIYTFLVDGEKEELHLTYQELDRQARSIGAMLQSVGAKGERVLLLYPPGLAYIAAFFGCLYAGAVAVPAYPPRANRNFLRIKAIVEDARPSVVLSTSALASGFQRLITAVPEMKSLRLLATDQTAHGHLAEAWEPPPVDGGSLAFLQYTSGSTALPKGAMVSHGNLLYNERMIQQAFRQTAESVIVSWLPLYHDMGLIGAVIQPLCIGAQCVLMSPEAFLQKPARWLEAISRYGATTSGGPNFGYDLCVRKITEEDRLNLDLRSWTTAFNGAEAVRLETMERFANAFKSCGFRPESFYPCYGLAEATLFVSGPVRGSRPASCALQPAELEKNRVRTAPAQSAEARTFVSCGRSWLGQEIRIVDPLTRALCPADRVGEIWVGGANVVQGYWNRPEETAETFRAYMSDTGEGPFLRTGDLGFIQNGELYVSGRLKDLIIIRGRNHYPQDIERTVEASHPGLQPAGCAAFSFDADGEERLVVAQELRRDYRNAAVEEVVNAIRQSVAEAHHLHVYAVALIRHGSILKTSSGKIQRQACRSAYLNGSLEIIGSHVAAVDRQENEEPLISREALAAAHPGRQKEIITEYLGRRVARLLRISPSGLDPQTPLTALGIDSLAALELKHEIESSLGASLPLTMLLQGSSTSELAGSILGQIGTQALVHSAQPLPVSTMLPECGLSPGQQALWFLHQLAPASAVYNVSSAVRITGRLDRPVMRQAIQKLVDRHAALRTVFTVRDGEPVQRARPLMPACVYEVDAGTWSEDRLKACISEEAHRPFDLEQGPLLRIHIFTRAPHESALLLTMHHIIGDFWSLGALIEELGLLYETGLARAEASLPPLGLEYTDYVRWQAQWLASGEGERMWNYWQGQLTGDLPVLSFPSDRVRPPVQTHSGDSLGFTVDDELTCCLKGLAAARGTTLYTVLLSAFQILLYRYTGQEEILVGSPASGRSRPEFANVVGYFVNPVVLRASFAAEQSFGAAVDRMRATVLGALEHQDYPFASLVARLQPQRDPSRAPVFQVMFILQKANRLAAEGLTSFALGQAGARMKLGGLSLEAMDLEQRVAQFELTLVMAEAQGRLAGSLQYNTSLFDRATISRVSCHFQNLLRGIVAARAQSVSTLPLLSGAEETQIVSQWNETRTAVDGSRLIHRIFEARVQRTPDSTALIFKGLRLSYAELNSQANRLAWRLKAMGVGPDVLVGICLERSPEMLVAILAVLKAGGAYLPMDPGYPEERLAFMLEDSKAAILLTDTGILVRFKHHLFASLSAGARTEPAADEPEGGACRAVRIDSPEPPAAGASADNLADEATPGNLAYVIYTSGSTGKPKGVMVCHGNVANFFAGMDQRIECDETDVLLAVTSISFDISVLELLWALTRGMRVILLSESASANADIRPRRISRRNDVKFSLFYFGGADSSTVRDRYRLLVEGAKYADRHGFEAVWTPERHFHSFGGLYSNPSLTSALLAGLTERIRLRAGSAVLPLHNPIRVAEEWSVVDNMSNGRVGVSFASGWHADDFAFFPDNYADRKELMYRGVEIVRRLWRGESIITRGGAGADVEVTIYPKPLQPELPVWITAAYNPETFIQAGAIGANVLTHLLGQDLDEVARKIKLYRESRDRHGYDPQTGRVTLMLHTFLGADREAVKETVRGPFTNYLNTSVDLIANLIKSLHLSLDLTAMGPKDKEDLLDFAFDRYFETSALFGAPDTCQSMVDHLDQIGVDEVGCLIDFGVDVDQAMASLEQLSVLRERSEKGAGAEDYSLAAQAARYGATLLQCTPSMMQMLSVDTKVMEELKSIRILMLGGEALPPALVKRLAGTLPARVVNMYGPTETTVWSATHQVSQTGGAVPIGHPIANTQIYVLDRHFCPVPPGVSGELLIGGEGVTRGYLWRPDLTAERFLPDPFSSQSGNRLYRTGDLARQRADGALEFLGRLDYQVKVRGYRIELEEIEAVICEHPGMIEAVVVAREQSPGDVRLAAYLLLDPESGTAPEQLRAYVSERLPGYMVPGVFMPVEELPRTSNGKIDRKALPAADWGGPRSDKAFAAPGTALEKVIATVLGELLGVDRVGLHDNFFELGGHSLLASQAVMRVRDILQVELPLRHFFEAPTVGQLAAHFEAVSRAEHPDVERIAEIWLEVDQLSAEDIQRIVDEQRQPATV